MQDTTMIGTMVAKTTNIFTAPWYKVIMAFFLTLLAPLYAAMLGLFILVIIDFLLGIWRAVKESKFSFR